jgi:hypothetical protein
MDTPTTIWRSFKQGHWVFSLDLKDGYFQIPIHLASHKYLRMEFRGQVFQFKSLPVGVSTAPWLISMIVMVAKDLYHQQGLTLFQYLDDWLGDAQSRSEAAERSQLLVDLCDYLGFLSNQEKSEFIPTHVFDFVGLRFDLTLAGFTSLTTR